MGLINDFLGSVRILSTTIDEWMEQELREVTDNRVTPSQLKVLKLVARTNARRIGDVADFLAVSNAAASKAVDRLVRRGLVRRTEAAADRRAVELSLTPEGRTLLAQYEAATNHVLKELFGGLDQDQLRDTARFLDRLSTEVVKTGRVRDGICLRCGIHFRDRCILRQSVGKNCYFHMHKDPTLNHHDSLPTVGESVVGEKVET
ncbi:MAG: MarR family winged helix-turn-helix transcriptional regulator [Longimicrobiales bacterium]